MRGVLFDLWGTLIERTTPPLSEGLARALGPGSEQAAAAWLKTAGRRDATVAWADIAEGLWTRLRAGPPPADFLEQAAAVRDEFVEGTRLAPGAEVAVAAVREAGSRVGALSNATAVTLAVVARLELGELLGDVWVSCQTGRLKPEPEAFAVPLEGWGMAPADVAMVGDSLADDVNGALGAGLTAVWLSPGAAGGEAPPGVLVAGSLEAVPAVLGAHP